MVRKLGGPGAAFLIKQFREMKKEIEKDRSGIFPFLLKSKNDVISSTEAEPPTGKVKILVNPSDLEEINFRQKVYGEMYKNISAVTDQQDTLSSKFFMSISNTVVLTSVLELGVISSAVGLKIFETGFKKTASKIKDQILGDKDAQESFKTGIENAVVSSGRLKQSTETEMMKEG